MGLNGVEPRLKNSPHVGGRVQMADAVTAPEVGGLLRRQKNHEPHATSGERLAKVALMSFFRIASFVRGPTLL